MDKKTEEKIVWMHTIAGVVAGVISGLYIKGTNLSIINILAIGIILSYPLSTLSKKFFNLTNEEFKLKDWLGKGFFFFFMTWILIWTFIYNL